MAKRRRGSVMTISAERAHQALTYLVHEGKIGAREIEKALANRDRLIREIRERMAALGVDGARAGRRLGKSAAAGLRSAEKATRGGVRRDARGAARPGTVHGGRAASLQRGAEKDQGDPEELRSESGD